MEKNFEKLEVWKRSCQLAVATYKAFENCRDYGLVGQITRAAVSVPSNIAEGAERQTKKEFIQFLYIAKGSIAEFRTQAYIAGKLKTIPANDVKFLTGEAMEISRMLQGLIDSIKKSDN
ncbi:MAG: four helix bundle protein [Victivallaceae bacterium]|nr:four helix bundle protein [Victivallaceae bacterium]